MWTVVVDSDEYVIRDHNGDEQGRLPTENGITTTAVKQIMHGRCATLREELQRGGGESPIDIGTIVEWATTIEDMAGENIELPGGNPEQ